jgi:hypothetical protein
VKKKKVHLRLEVLPSAVHNKKTTRKKKTKKVEKRGQKIKKKVINQMDRKQPSKTKTMKNVTPYSLTLKWMMSVKHLKNSYKFVRSAITI